MTQHYTVWGSRHDYANGTPIRLMGGTIAECRRESAYRRQLGGWTLTTVREGVMPSDSWLTFAREQSSNAHPVRQCIGCLNRVSIPTDHAEGCPTGQNGTPNYE